MERKATNGETGIKKWKTFGVWLLPLHTRETEAQGRGQRKEGSSCWDGETGPECSHWPVASTPPPAAYWLMPARDTQTAANGIGTRRAFPGDAPANSRTRKRSGWTGEGSQSAAAKAAGRPMARRWGRDDAVGAGPAIAAEGNCRAGLDGAAGASLGQLRRGTLRQPQFPPSGVSPACWARAAALVARSDDVAGKALELRRRLSEPRHPSSVNWSHR